MAWSEGTVRYGAAGRWLVLGAVWASEASQVCGSPWLVVLVMGSFGQMVAACRHAAGRHVRGVEGLSESRLLFCHS